MKNYTIVMISIILIVFSFFNFKKKYFTSKDLKVFYANTFHPNIKFTSDTLNVGNILNKESKIAGYFSFINSGRGELLIQSVNPACGCTAVEWTKNPIAHNMTGIVKFSIDTKEIDTGAFEKKIVINTNGYFGKKIISIIGIFHKK